MSQEKQPATAGAELVQQGAAALRAGETALAADLLVRALRRSPYDDRAWLWLSGVVSRDGERRYCLEQALKSNPHNAHARKGLTLLAGVPAQTPLVVKDIYPDPTPMMSVVAAPPPAAPPPTVEEPPPVPAWRPDAPRRTRRAGMVLALGVFVLVGVALAAGLWLGTRPSVEQQTATSAAGASGTVGEATTESIITAATPAATATVAPLSLTPQPEELEAGLQIYAGDYATAVEDFTVAINTDPTHVEAYFLRGRAAFEMGDYDAAMADFTQVVQLDSEHIEALYQRGRARSRAGDVRGALIDFEQAALRYRQTGQMQQQHRMILAIERLQAQTE